VSDRVLLKSYKTPEAFQEEYASNLTAGGVFVATSESFELGERVTVAIELVFCRQGVKLPGEVVHQVTAEMAQMGGEVGVAVQVDGTAHTVRAQLEPLRAVAGAQKHQPKSQDRRRRAPRFAARVPVELEFAEGPISGHTRNLSQTGGLVSVPDRGAEAGERIRLTLFDPETSQAMSVDAVIIRQLESDGGIAALALDFVLSDAERPAMNMMIDSIQASEHARRLGGIEGSISELGVPNLLQMFGATGQPGTLSLKDGEREGVIGFEGGMLRFVRLGPVSGLKALVRLLSWTGGRFEFHARLDDVESREPPLPLDAALLEATRLLDEEVAGGAPEVADDIVLQLVDPKALDADDLSKVEAAVVDLARAGFDVGRMLAVIPEPDLVVRQAIAALVEREVIAP
jgi:Tfp pilus assembly protein PilZ